LILSRGLFIGRFQPFHLGHKACIDFALQEVNDLIIGVGSSQASFEPKNPFTGGERILMIKKTLNADPKVDQRRILIVPISDINVHSLWTSHIKILVPTFEVVFANDQFTSLLFKETGVKVVNPPMIKRTVLSGSEIRRRIVNDIKWTRLISPQTETIIKEINGVERIKRLYLCHC
jgi:nicotinamide-nucleotide adenylyltransferase